MGGRSSSSTSSSQSQTTTSYQISPQAGAVAVAGSENVTIQTVDDKVIQAAESIANNALDTVESSVDAGLNFADKVVNDSMDTVNAALEGQTVAMLDLAQKIKEGDATVARQVTLAVVVMLGVVMVFMVVKR